MATKHSEFKMHIEIQSDTSTKLRVRAVCEEKLAAEATGAKCGYAVAHGGAVCNSYGYPAETEGALAVARTDGSVVVYRVRLPANKVTTGGVLRAIASYHGVIAAELLIPRFDSRYSSSTWDVARHHARKALDTLR